MIIELKTAGFTFQCLDAKSIFLAMTRASIDPLVKVLPKTHVLSLHNGTLMRLLKSREYRETNLVLDPEQAVLDDCMAVIQIWLDLVCLMYTLDGKELDIEEIDKRGSLKEGKVKYYDICQSVEQKKLTVFKKVKAVVVRYFN